MCTGKEIEFFYMIKFFDMNEGLKEKIRISKKEV
jgi:hypothetical protein